MYGYPQPFNHQGAVDRINNQIRDLENLRTQLQSQPTNLTQNFQIAPNNGLSSMKFVNNMEEVKNENIMTDTPFFSKDMSVVWIKNPKGEIKTYELNEIVKKDEKDILIEGLQYQIAELRKEIKDAKSVNVNVDEPTKGNKSSEVSTVSTNAEKSE